MLVRQLRLFAAPLTLALCFILLLANDQRLARPSASPSLQGEAAIEHLKAQGLYGSLREAMEAAPYRISEMQEGSYRGANQAQSLRAEFDPAGLRLKPREGAKWESGMRLRGYGYGERIVPVAAGEMKASGNRLEIHHSTIAQSTISEWYVNRPSGLEQGFTISAPPDERSAAARLRLSLEVTGDLEPHLSADGGAVVLREQNGAEALRYSKLLAYDARGRELAAEMKLEGREVRLEVADEGAQYPLTIDPVFTQQAYLKASNTGESNQFGWSVAISGDTVVVGAPSEDSSATGVDGNQNDNSAGGSGAAYVFVRSGGMWSQQAYLKASNTDSPDEFGYTVAISGDTVIVGAHWESSSATGVNGDQSDNSAFGAGAAYVFVRSDGMWSQQAYLKASNAEADDWFGRSVAISGDTVVVAASAEDSSATGVNGNQSDNSASPSGAAYVFVRSGGIWSQQAYLKASNTEKDDFYGISVGISGNTVVVGAPREASNATGVDGDQSNNSAPHSGAAYVYVRSGGIWIQQAYLKASNTTVGDWFGTSVAISGGTVVVGAENENSSATGVNGDQSDNSVWFSGAAYTFVDLTPPICPLIPFPDLPAGTAGVAYSQTLATSHADNYSYSLVSGTLPPGFSLSSAGLISGLTTISGTYNFTILARTPEGCIDTHDYALVIGCPEIVISPTSLPNGTVGGSYSVTLSATPAAGNYTFTITAGSLPTGLTLNATTGKISGSPSQNGVFNFTVRATGFGSCSASRSYSIQIGSTTCGTITLANLGGGTVGNLYNQAATASPAGSYSYALTSGSLPPGLTLYSSTGQLYGYPTVAGTYNFTIRASRSRDCTGSRSYAVTISGTRR